jgi:hypothetical protein
MRVIVRAGGRKSPWWAPNPTATGRADGVPLELVLPEIELLRLQLVDATTGAAPDILARSLSNALHARRISDGFECAQDLEIDLAGFVEFELLAGEHELALDLAAAGYLPAIARATVASDAPPRVIEIVRGVQARVHLEGDADGGPTPLSGHLVFLVEHGQLGRISGPLPEDQPYNNRINGIRMRIDDPVLMQQMLTGDFYDTGIAELPCLAPGRYVVKCYPDDFTFEPAEHDVRGPGPVELDVRWRAR